jgi:hypothetical protein
MATSQSSAPPVSVTRHQALAAEHAALEGQLQQLQHKRYLSPNEELELMEIKKRKLVLKDAMQHLQT